MRDDERRPTARGPLRWIAAGTLALLVLAGCQTDNDEHTENEEATSAPDGEADDGGIEMTFPAEGIELEGSLRLPDTEPAATVVVIAGSGPQSRDGWAAGQLGLTFPEPVPVYRQLAEGLVAAGYGVVTWDKRTCGSFNNCAPNDYPGPSEDLVFGTLVDDAAAVVDALAQRDDLGELVLVGHSKGGTIGAAVAADRDDLGGLVLLATPQPDIAEAMAVQADTLEGLVSAAGLEGTAADEGVEEVRAIAREVAAVADGDVSGAPIGGATRDFWAGWIEASRDAPASIAELDIPVLALGGEQDWNVPPAQVEAWEAHLPADGEMVILPGITHPLTRLGTDDVAAITPDDLGLEVDDAVVTALTDWLSERFPDS